MREFRSKLIHLYFDKEVSFLKNDMINDLKLHIMTEEYLQKKRRQTILHIVYKHSRNSGILKKFNKENLFGL